MKSWRIQRIALQNILGSNPLNRYYTPVEEKYSTTITSGKSLQLQNGGVIDIIAADDNKSKSILGKEDGIFSSKPREPTNF